jgi:hypothetical protein
MNIFFVLIFCTVSLDRFLHQEIRSGLLVADQSADHPPKPTPGVTLQDLRCQVNAVDDLEVQHHGLIVFNYICWVPSYGRSGDRLLAEVIELG